MVTHFAPTNYLFSFWFSPFTFCFPLNGTVLGLAKKAPGVMRFGKRSQFDNGVFDNIDESAARSLRASPGVMRFGKRASPGVMRFGKRASPGVMRFGKRSIDDEIEEFDEYEPIRQLVSARGVPMNFGKRANPGVMQFGKRASPGVMRFGKRGTPGVMRFGKRNTKPQTPGLTRFGK